MTVLSKGWQYTFGSEGTGNHICTMCSRGTYGHCDEACAYRRNFFWSGAELGQWKPDHVLSADQIKELRRAFIEASADQTYRVPQKLELTETVLSELPDDHPFIKSGLRDKARAKDIFTVISVAGAGVTDRDQLALLADEVSRRSAPALIVISNKGVRVYEVRTKAQWSEQSAARLSTLHTASFW